MDKNTNIPTHIAIIPDGNGRWAKKNGLPRNAGHKVGGDVFRTISKYASSIGVKYLSFYAFSTENWSRPQDEVDGLMELLSSFLNNADKELNDTGIRIIVSGSRNKLSAKLIAQIDRIVQSTSGNKGMVLNIALNYGGREELVQAFKSVANDVKNGVYDTRRIDESLISSKLYTAGMPDPDMLIRTSGEMRISNFLLWQMAYTEFIFSDVLWPSFDKKCFDNAIKEFNSRKRRFGGI